MSSQTFSPFPLTQRLKNSNDITKETGIYFDSIKNLLPSMRFVQKRKNRSWQGVCHHADAQWVTPSLMQFKPEKRKDSQFSLDKKDRLKIDLNKFSFLKVGNHLNIYFFRVIQIFALVWLLCYEYFCPLLSWSQKTQRKVQETFTYRNAVQLNLLFLRCNDFSL